MGDRGDGYTPERAAPRAPATWRVVLVLALPVFVQQMLLFSVNLSDRVLAGRLQPFPLEQQVGAAAGQVGAVGLHAGSALGTGLGDAALAAYHWDGVHQFQSRHVAYQAAQTTAHYLAWFINCYTVFVTVGSTALVARCVGAGDRAQANRVANQAILLAVAFGLVGSLGGLLGVDRLVHVLGLRGEAAGFAASYLRPLFTLLAFQIVEAAGIACFIGAGDTRTGLGVMLGVALLNVPLAWGFFLGVGPVPPLRFVGIALGTAVSHALAGLVVLFLLARGHAGLRLDRTVFRPDWHLLYRLLRVSVPAGVDSLSLVAGQFWFLSIVNTLGNTASSAHGLALLWESLGYLSGVAFGTAAMSLVGRNLGARLPQQAARSGWVALLLGGAVMCAMGLVFFTFAREMFAFICAHKEQQGVVEAGVPVLRLVAFAMPAVSCTIILPSALRGAGDTRVPLLFTWVGFLGVRIPLAYWLTQGPPDMGLFGAWLAMFADLYVRGAFFLLRFASGRWQAIKV